MLRAVPVGDIPVEHLDDSTALVLVHPIKRTKSSFIYMRAYPISFTVEL